MVAKDKRAGEACVMWNQPALKQQEPLSHKGCLWGLLWGLSIPTMFPITPSSTQGVSSRKETNSLASNNPVNLFQYTTGSLMWRNQISRPLQHLFLAIVMCYLFSLQKAAGELSCHHAISFKKKKKRPRKISNAFREIIYDLAREEIKKSSVHEGLSPLLALGQRVTFEQT